MSRVAVMLCALWSFAAGAQAEEYADNVSMVEYLHALEQIGAAAQIGPAARDGALAYADAYRRKCKRDLTTMQLRKAMADGDGDPALKAMIRASYYHDAQAIEALGASVPCGR